MLISSWVLVGREDAARGTYLDLLDRRMLRELQGRLHGARTLVLDGLSMS